MSILLILSLLSDVCDWLEPFVIYVCQNKTFGGTHFMMDILSVTPEVSKTVWK